MAVRNFRALLGRLRAEGHCVLFSSHVMQEVAALCDDIVVIAHGTVVASGTPDEIRARAGRSDLEEAFVELTGTAPPAGTAGANSREGPRAGLGADEPPR
jgi:sodium transport system ATP-binding protein